MFTLDRSVSIAGSNGGIMAVLARDGNIVLSQMYFTETAHERRTGILFYGYTFSMYVAPLRCPLLTMFTSNLHHQCDLYFRRSGTLLEMPAAGS